MSGITVDRKEPSFDDAEKGSFEQRERVEELAQPDLVVDPEAEKKLLRRVDWRLLPMIWLCLVMSYIDRTNIGNAKVAGMYVDLNMNSSDYALVLSVFFIGYLLWEPPSNMILSRSRPSIYIPALMVLWGSLSVAPKGINSTAGMAVFRFVLGIVEAGFWPGCMLVMSCWYKVGFQSLDRC